MNVETVHLPIRERALPSTGEVDVWLADLAALPFDPGPPETTGRRERVVRQRVQQQFFLRLLLGAYLGCPGKAVRLTRSDRGKPALTGEHADSTLQFNLSHSGRHLAVAVARDAAVGIDIESERRLSRARLLASRFLSAAEADWLAGLDEPFRSQQFLQQWTAREALVKARGCGLAGSLRGMELSWRPPGIRRLPDGWSNAREMALSVLSPPAGLVGHIASVRGPIVPVLRCIEP